MLWTIISAIAAVVSTITYILTAIYVRDQLKGQRQDRYLHVTTELFTNWQDREFMEAQLWLVHRLQENDWQGFVAKHRCDYGEIAFNRVGGFYDRVGTLVRLGFVNEQEILTTIGGHAIAVWNKIEPLVRRGPSDRELRAVPRLRADVAGLPCLLCPRPVDQQSRRPDFPRPARRPHQDRRQDAQRADRSLRPAHDPGRAAGRPRRSGPSCAAAREVHPAR